MGTTREQFSILSEDSKKENRIPEGRICKVLQQDFSEVLNPAWPFDRL
jgi:hypothetical protein